MPPTVHMAFGPNKGFVLWVIDSPGEDRIPKYRSSDKIPLDLLGRLYSAHPAIERLRSVAIGEGQNYAVTYQTVTKRVDAEWDLMTKYPRLHRILKDSTNRGDAVISIGPDGDFFEVCDGHKHAPNQYNPTLTDHVHEMSTTDLKMVTMGLKGCGLILEKSGEIHEHGPLINKYKTLIKDLRKHMNARSGKKAVSVALNPFKEDEYFVAFEDGTFCYQSEALGGHCEPVVGPCQRYDRHWNTADPNLTKPDEVLARETEIAQSREFDALMKAWKVKSSLEPWDQIDARFQNPVDWLMPRAILQGPGETQNPQQQSSQDWGIWGRADG